MNVAPVALAFAVCEPPRTGGEELAPVILLHGAGDSKEIWGTIPKIIAGKSNRKVFALDARNHGDSEWSEEFNFDINVDDLLHFMDTHSIGKSVLVGHSMGGVTSIGAALRWPHKVEMVFVEDKYVGRVGQKTLNSALRYFQLCEESAEGIPPDCDMSEVQKRIADNLFEKGSQLKAVGSRESLDRIHFAMRRSEEEGRYVWKTNWKVVQDAMRDADKLMSEPQGVFNGPACFIYGSLSSMRVGEKEEHIRQFFPKAEFVRVEGADHYIHPHHPEQFAEIVVGRLLMERASSSSLKTNL